MGGKTALKPFQNPFEERKNGQDGAENRAEHREKQTNLMQDQNNANTLNYPTHIHQQLPALQQRIYTALSITQLIILHGSE